ncbi:unnamed protein product [Rotaria sp. Silwood1]|nr:unnamed protein product [Rotaria sp. Silwood1]
MTSTLLVLDTTGTIIHLAGPCLLHLISIVLTLTSIVRRKVYLSSNNLSYFRAWLDQIGLHRDYFIPPILILLCFLPHLIFFNILTNVCYEPKLSLYSHLHIFFNLITFVPQALTFFIYIYPSTSFLTEFYRSTVCGCVIQRLCLGIKCK